MFNVLYVPCDPNAPMYAVPIEAQDVSPVRALVGYPAGMSIFDDGTAYAAGENSRAKGERVNERAAAVLEYVCEGSGIVEDIRGDVVILYADEDGPKGVQPTVVAAIRKLYPRLVPSKTKRLPVGQLPSYLAEMSPMGDKNLPEWEWLTSNLDASSDATVIRVGSVSPDKVVVKVLAKGKTGKWFCFTAMGTAPSWTMLNYA